MKKIKGKAIYTDYEGEDSIFTVRCKNMEDAIILISQCAKDYNKPEIISEKITEDVMYYCGLCEFMTIGEALCCECGEPLKTVARQTFMYDFTH